MVSSIILNQQISYFLFFKTPRNILLKAAPLNVSLLFQTLFDPTPPVDIPSPRHWHQYSSSCVFPPPPSRLAAP